MISSRIASDEVAFSDAERAAFRQAKHPDAMRFYRALREDLAGEFLTGMAFHLPGKVLAAREFMPGRRDRRWYMRLTKELLRLGLIERLTPAGFRADGTRRPATYAFTRHRPSLIAGNVVDFAVHRRRRCGDAPATP